MAGSMRVRCVRDFYDQQEHEYRKVGDVFTVTPSRLEQINATRYGQLVEKATQARKATKE